MTEQMVAPPMASRSQSLRLWATRLALVGWVLVAFWPVWDNGFVHFDEDGYILNNEAVRNGLSPSSIGLAFTTFCGGNWHPLTMLSHMLDCELYGLNPDGHHASSLLLHIAVVLLVFHWLRQVSGAFWAPAIVAGLFAIHPLRVESVAWLAERKDVLCALFWMLGLIAYTRYRRGLTARWYLLCLLFYAMSLMAKPMAVTFPVVLLLVDYTLGPGPSAEAILTTRDSRADHEAPRSFMRLVIQKTPFFLLAAAASVVTLIAQHDASAVASITVRPIGYRLANAVLQLGTYLRDTVWPQQLAVFYPPLESIPLGWMLVSAAVLLAISLALFLLRPRYARWLGLGWWWFLITVLPVLGIIQVGMQARADRYMYIPHIGLFIAVIWAIKGLWETFRLGPALAGALTVVVLTFLASGTWQQCQYWRNGETLFRHAISVTRGNYLAWGNLGHFLQEKGDLDAAETSYRTAFSLEPRYTEALFKLGTTLLHQQRYEQAIEYLRETIRREPGHLKARHNLGTAYYYRGDYRKAIATFETLLKQVPDHREAHLALATVLTEIGALPQAIEHYQRALPEREAYVRKLLQLADTMKNTGRSVQAEFIYQQLRQQLPSHKERPEKTPADYPH